MQLMLRLAQFAIHVIGLICAWAVLLTLLVCSKGARSKRVASKPRTRATRMARLLAATIAIFATPGLAGTTALGQTLSGQATASDQIERHLHNYGDLDRTCLRWTDRCRNCNRGSDAIPMCSNIGISCTPDKIECVQRMNDDEKK